MENQPKTASKSTRPSSCSAPLKTWRIVRHVREEYAEEAATREEALAMVDAPHTVTVTKETCVCLRAQNSEIDRKGKEHYADSYGIYEKE